MLNHNTSKASSTPVSSSVKDAIPTPTRVTAKPSCQPQRVQLSRKRGWRKPPYTVVVARPSKWGNPFKMNSECPIEEAIANYQAWLKTDLEGIKTLVAAKIELRGKNLACWCKPGQPCHADVLLRLVNENRNNKK